MYIQALELKNFKLFDDKKIVFPSDMTIVKGKNESGKSSILEALVAALFFDPTSAVIPQYIRDYQSWGSSNLYKINLFFEANGNNYILEKDFENQKILFKKENGDAISHDFSEISQVLQELGGYSNKELFGNVSVIRKNNLEILDKGKKKIIDSLQDMISGSNSNVSVSALLKKLKKTSDELVKGLDPSRPAKNVGKIKLIQERISDLEENLKKMKNSFKKKQQNEIVLNEFFEALSEMKEQLDVLKREYESNSIYFLAIKEIKKINEPLDQILQDMETYNVLEKEKESFLHELSKTKTPKESDIEKIEILSDKIKFHKQHLENIENTIRDLASQHKKFYYPSRKIFVVTFSIASVLGLAGLFWPQAYLFWGFASALVAWYFISGEYSRAVKVVDIKKERQKRQEEFDKENRALDNLLSSFKVESLEKIKDLNKLTHERKINVKNLSQQQKTLLRGRNIEYLLKQKINFQKQLGVSQSKITPEQEVRPPTAREQREIEHKLAKVEKNIKNKNEEYLEARAHVKSIDVSQEDILEHEEKIVSLKENLNNLQKRVKIFDILLSTLKEARIRALAKTKNALQEMMSSYIAEITGGKYTSIRLKNNFDVEVFSSEKEDFVTADVLSTGAVDQLYIVARFALIQRLYNTGETNKSKQKFNKRPVVILDDPFGNFDEERRENILHLLERLSHDFQIIMFTCVSNYDEWGKVVKI